MNSADRTVSVTRKDTSVLAECFSFSGRSQSEDYGSAMGSNSDRRIIEGVFTSCGISCSSVIALGDRDLLRQQFGIHSVSGF